MGLSVSDEKIENIMNEEMIGSGVYYLCLMNCPTLIVRISVTVDCASGILSRYYYVFIIKKNHLFSL